MSKKYILTVKVLGKLFTATGKNFDEAFDNLGIKNAKGISVWTFEHEGRKREKVVGSAITSRVFTLKGLAGEIARKNLNALLGV